MKPLDERYREFCNKHKAKVDKELAEAGLPPVGLNMLYQPYPPMTFEEYAIMCDGIMADLADEGFKFRKSQSAKAKKKRGKITDDSFTIGDIINWLAGSAIYEEESSKELWDQFLGKLDQYHLNPKEIPHPSRDIKKLQCEYDFKDGRKTISFGQFAKMVSRIRTGKKKLP